MVAEPVPAALVIVPVLSICVGVQSDWKLTLSFSSTVPSLSNVPPQEFMSRVAVSSGKTMVPLFTSVPFWSTVRLKPQ